MKRLFISATVLVVALAAVLGLQGCKTPIDKSKLEGYWVLTQLNGEATSDIFKGSVPTLEFNFADSVVLGSAGCNRYLGKFQITANNEFFAPNLALGMKMCLFENKESEFVKALTDSPVMSLGNDGVLTFKKGEQVTLQFVLGQKDEKIELEPVTLDALSGKWTLVSMGETSIKDLFKEQIPYIEFSADGNATGNSGCNNFRSKVELGAENMLTFAPLMSTKMACPGLEGENMFSILLQTPVQAVVVENTLTFIKDGVSVLEFKKN